MDPKSDCDVFHLENLRLSLLHTLWRKIHTNLNKFKHCCCTSAGPGRYICFHARRSFMGSIFFKCVRVFCVLIATLSVVSILYVIKGTPWLALFHFPEVSSKSGAPPSYFINCVVQKTHWCWLTSKWLFFPSTLGFRTDIQRRIFLRGEIVDVGDAEGLHRGLPDPTQDVSQEHVDPHGQVGLALAPCRTQTVTACLQKVRVVPCRSSPLSGT